MNTKKKLDWLERTQMINSLINDDVDMIKDDFYILEHVLRSGHKGYANYTDAELRRAYASL